MIEPWIALGLFLTLLLLVTPLLGRYMARLFDDVTPSSIPILSSLEKAVYSLCGIDPKEEMNWKCYLKAMLYFNSFGLLFLFILQLAQGWLPLNPQNLPGVPAVLAFNTAVSFTTNTNWQAYGGEVTLSYLTQMLGLTVQNFLSPATGMAALLALIRGFVRTKEETLGNFWRDITRSVIYLFLPLSLLFALVLVSQGVIQNFSHYLEAHTLIGEIQTIPMGPVASQVAIKQLGTNGGGFFNANGAHPFENPTPLSNFLEAFAILCIPAASVYMYGILISSKRHAWIIFGMMLFLWLGGLATALVSEFTNNPVLGANPVLEGQETRFGTVATILWAVSTTATSNGSVDAMHSSLSPLAGGVAMFNMMLGEVIFGGVGVGLCGMVKFTILTVFLAGLMVGRTPEYLGKKIEKKEMQWVMLALLSPCALILLGASLAAILPTTLDHLANSGPHGLSEILYTFSSASGNNGSSFAGFQANTTFYNLLLGLIMLVTRLAILVPSLTIAGSLARKPTVAPSLGTFATDNILFAILLFAVIMIVGALTFFPALSLGPIVEQLLMLRGQAF